MQLDLPGRLGVPDGRYLARADEGDAVLVVETLGTPLPTRRPLRRPKPSPASREEIPEVPLTRMTAVAPTRLAGEDEGRRWLAALRSDAEAAHAEVRAGVALMNRALAAYRAGSGDPHVPDAVPRRALAVRVGWGTGDQMADSSWTDALELPPDRSRRDEVEPQERIAAVLAGNDTVTTAELLLLRARADLEAGRLPEAAIELQAARNAITGATPGTDEATLRAEIRALARELRAQRK